MITVDQVETLAEAWPWDFEEVQEALTLADAEGWPLDDTVRGLDALAEDFGAEGDPVGVVKAAIAAKRPPNLRWSGPS